MSGLALSGIWHAAGLVTLVAGAIAAATAAAWLTGRRDRFGPAGTAVVAALALSAVWCLVVAASGPDSFFAHMTESLRNLSWLVVIYRLFASDGRHASLAPIRPVVFALTLVEIFNLLVVVIASRLSLEPQTQALAFEISAMFRLLGAVGALVLLHNLYVGASLQSRLILRWPAAGMAIMWALDLNLYAITYLSNGVPPLEIAALRGTAALVLVGLLTIGASRDRDIMRLMPSRAVTFQTFSLLIIGLYLIGMVAVAEWLSYAGGDFARLATLGFVTGASVLALLLLPSKRMRGWMRVTVAKHLFQHRYDYREEWLRFTRTIGRSGPDALPLGERVVQAVADIADSPAGLLLSPGDNGDLVLAARWNWSDIEVPASAFPARAQVFFEREAFIADLDEIRARSASKGGDAFVPDWLLDDPRAWALVPLIHYERLVGMVVLVRPPFVRRFDWEDFDLLRVVGQQLASYLAENDSQEALAEASRFDDFHRRIAFVMHDIKNLASQFSLLARNAELHAEKKEFRDDMLVTLRASSEKLNAMIARLSRYGNGSVERLKEVNAEAVARSVVERFAANHPVVLTECEDLTVTGDAHSMEQVLVHLVQNGLDASPPDSPVFVNLTAAGLNAQFEVIDSGCGMSPDFVRNRLFKPFVSTKNGGFGIGAFEARELVKGMRGRLEVESREGLGSRFVFTIPLAAATDIYDQISTYEERQAS